MPLKLLHVENDSDFDELTRVEFVSFETPVCKLKDLFFPQLEPGSDAREAAIKEAAQRQTGWHRGDPTNQWVKVVDTDTGKMLGAACWHVYTENPYANAADSDEECDWFPAGEDREMANSLMEQFLTPRMTYMCRPHVFLNVCFTHPDARRKGVGKLLVEWGVVEADKRGYDSYVDATAEALQLYRSYGFIEGERREFSLAAFKSARKDELEKLLIPFVWWPMYRPAGGKYEAGKDVLPWEKK